MILRAISPLVATVIIGYVEDSGVRVKITKEKFLSVLSSVEDFEILKNEKKPLEDDNVLLARWKGQSLFVIFNDKKLPKEIINDDDVNDTVSYDFAISLIELAQQSLGNVEPLVKYKIANYTNIKSDYDSVVIYREDMDLFTIDVKHNAFSRSNTPHDLKVSFISMVLTGVVTSQLLREQIKAYKEKPEKFLKDCLGV